MMAVDTALSVGENQTLERSEGPVHSKRFDTEATICPAISSGNRLGPACYITHRNSQ